MEEMELPAGWTTAQVGEVCRLLNGRAYNKNELLDSGKYRVLRVGNLFTNPHWYHSDLELDEDKYCQAGDLLYAWSASFGPHVWEGERVIYHYHIWKVEHDEDLICRDFLKVFFQWDTNRIKQQQGSGSTMLHVTKKSMEERAIPIPPTAEQRRIASKLDTTLAAVDACRQRLDGVAELLKRFRQAVLAAATSGELTREGREVDESWEDQVLGNLLSDLRYGTAQKCTYDDCGKPVLRIPNILEGSISHDDLKYAEFDQAEVEKLAIRAGDLLVIRSNGSLDLVGRTALASEADEGFLFAGYLIRLRPRQEVVNPGFLLLVLLSPVTRRRIELAARSTSGVNNINSKFLSGLQLGLPSLEEQHEIVRRAQDLFTLADQLEARLTCARKVVDRLTPALLAKAFRGELVPQDPGDEPASVLLERIRAARQGEAGAGKPTRRGPRKAAAKPDQTSLDAAPVPPDLLAGLLKECGALSERALLAASELEPGRFAEQLQLELQAGTIRNELEDGVRVLVGGG